MRAIDADKMLKDLEEGNAPLIGYVPRDWILSEPTISPFDYQVIDTQKASELIIKLLEGDWVAQRRNFSEKFDSPKAYNEVTAKAFKQIKYLASLISVQFIDPKELRENLSDIRWLQLKNPHTGELFVHSPEFGELVELAYPEWDKSGKKKAVSDIDI